MYACSTDVNNQELLLRPHNWLAWLVISAILTRTWLWWSQLMAETLYLTINLIDRFLELKAVTRKNLQLVGQPSL